MIDNEKVEILIYEIKHDTCTDLALIIYSIRYTPKSDSELDCKSSSCESETVVIKEKQYLFANKNFTFTDQDYETEVIMKQNFSRCETMKEGYVYGYEAQVYFPEILECYTHQDSTACGKWLISTPMTLVFIIPRNDMENKTSNMTVIDEDQQSWPKRKLIRSITLRNSKQLGSSKGHRGHKMAVSSNESNNSAENEESIDSCIWAVNQRLQLSQPPSDFPAACDEIGAMKAIGTKLGIDFETNGEIIEVTIQKAIDAKNKHWDRYVQ